MALKMMGILVQELPLPLVYVPESSLWTHF